MSVPFITPQQRKRRVYVAAIDAGFGNLNQLAKAMGMRRDSLMRTLESQDVKLSTLVDLADRLGVTVGYLVDK